MITGRQIREARGMLGWDVATLGLRADLCDRLIERAENPNRKLELSSRQGHANEAAFTRAGIEFPNHGQPGARLRKVFEA